MQIFWTKENIKIAKWEDCGSTYNVEILNYFNPELQLKGTESAVKKKAYSYLLNEEVLNSY